MRKTFFLLYFMVGADGSASTALEFEKKCEAEALRYCLKNMRVLELKRDMRLFHWFAGGHFAGRKPIDYINASLNSFGNFTILDFAGVAGTAGLYLATDPIGSCEYGAGRDPYLAVLNVPKGMRVGFMNPPWLGYFVSDCENAVGYKHRAMQSCLKEKKVALTAFSFGEWGKGMERSAFSGMQVAFTAGELVKADPRFVVRFYDWTRLRSKKTKEAAVIRREIFNAKERWRDACSAANREVDFLPESYPPEALDSWAKTYLLNKNGSLDFFKVIEAGEKGVAPKISAPVEEKHE